MIKNQEKIGTVIGVGMNGEGIIRDEDTTIFVPFVLPTEKIKYKILKVAKKYVYGKALEILTPAEERVKPRCPVFTKCGGCQLQHVRYANQLSIKENNVKTCFKKIANLDVDVSPTIVGDSEFHYRNKLQLPVGQNENRAIIGFYAENSHRVVEISDCVINGLWAKNIISAFNTYLKRFNVRGYDEKAHSGDVREITVKEINDKLIITVVTLTENLPYQSQLIEILREEITEEFSLYQNVNPDITNVIYGKEFRLLYGKGEYSNTMQNITYKIGVESFMQVNPSVCNKLYSAVRDCLEIDQETTVIDAYSGAGLMTALLSQNAKKAVGVEIIKEAVDIANSLAKENNLSGKITNYCGKCEELLPKIIREEKAKNNKVVVVLDPPRKGVDIKVIKSILECNIDKIAYVSCLPSSLARDIGLLVGSLEEVDGEIKRAEVNANRYKIEIIKPFDMFSQTKHIETLCILERTSHKS